MSREPNFAVVGDAYGGGAEASHRYAGLVESRHA
jgi:hypothetical protein